MLHRLKQEKTHPAKKQGNTPKCKRSTKANAQSKSVTVNRTIATAEKQGNKKTLECGDQTIVLHCVS